MRLRIVCLLAWMMGCAASTPAVKLTLKSPFPSQEEIRKLASAPLPTSPAQKPHSVTSWDFGEKTEGFPVAALEAAWSARTPGAATKFTPELHCLAHELARYFSINDGEPDERLRRWMGAVCGVTGVRARGAAGWLNVPPQFSEAQIITGGVIPEKMLPSALDRKGEVGLAMVRRGNRVALAVAIAPTLESTQVSAPDANGIVSVTAHLASDTGAAQALINQGAHGVTPCPLMSTEGTTFSWSCAMAPGDEQAWIEVGAILPGQLMTRGAARALVRRDLAKPVHYTASIESENAASESGDAALAKKVFDGINARRVEAHLPPLIEATTQSQGDNTRLAPYFFHAIETNSLEKLDPIVLGLMAGWGVSGTIRDATACGSLVRGSRSASEWVGAAMEMPSGRFCMLSKDAQQVALGVTTVRTLGGLGVVVSTYSMFEGRDHAEDVKALVAHINRLRAAKKLPPALWVQASESLVAAAARAAQGADPGEALRGALDHESEERQTSVYGLWAPAFRVEDVKLDPAILESPKLRIMVVATHAKSTNLPWGNLLLFVMSLPPTDG